MKSCLVDTGIVYAIYDRSDDWHARAMDFTAAYRGRLALATCAIPEVAYLVNKFLGARAEEAFVLDLARGEFALEELTKKDYVRAAQLIAIHKKLDIGFVDAATVALSERLKIADIATTDRRHFSVIKPAHRPALNLLPAE